MSYSNQDIHNEFITKQTKSTEKPLPTLEYSLKSISWHLKTISDTLAALREILEKKCL